MKSSLTFLSHWARSPLQTAAIWPSSMHLAEVMAGQIPPGTGLVVELGGGTGVITQALLRHSDGGRTLLVVEKNPELCKLIKFRLPAVRVQLGDACKLEQIIRQGNGDLQPDARAVVSGLGLRAMHPSVQARICSEAFSVLAPGGVFIQFTYGLRPPLDRRVQAQLGLTVSRAGWVMRNVPPATVYVYKRAGARNSQKEDR